jgi:osmotically-inducible protein OsmY
LNQTVTQLKQGMNKPPQGEPNAAVADTAVGNAAASNHAARSLRVDKDVLTLPRENGDDTDIAAAAQRALDWAACPLDAVTATVRRGLVTLKGQVTRSYERNAAECAVRSLPGVVGVSNLMTLVNGQGRQPTRLVSSTISS